MIDAVPKSNYAFKSLVFEIVRTQATVGLKERVFNDTFGNFVIYVDEIATDQVALRNVFVSDERKPEEQRFITAREGQAPLGRGEPAGHPPAPRRRDPRDQPPRPPEVPGGALPALRHHAGAGESPAQAGRHAQGRPRDESRRAAAGDAEADRRSRATRTRTWSRSTRSSRSRPRASSSAVLGVPLGIRAHRGGRWGAFVALLPIVLFYYVGLTLGENIGDHGRIPPWLAMWTPNLVVGALALYLLRASLKERPVPLVALLQRGFWAAVAWVQDAWQRGAPASRPRRAGGVGRGPGPRAGAAGAADERLQHRRPLPERGVPDALLLRHRARERRGDRRRPDDHAGALHPPQARAEPHPPALPLPDAAFRVPGARTSSC